MESDRATGKTERRMNHGAVVGWTHQDLGDRVVLRIQSKSAAGLDDDALDEMHYIMTKNQAAVLANYLFGISGRLPQTKRRSRWFG